jgi:hypothetical protein
MVATTMHSTLSRLVKDYPLIHFIEGADFYWSPDKATVFYKKNGPVSLLLHEVGHALLDHQDYDRDITLLSMERDAWDKARTLETIDEAAVQDHLDTYRHWLHARSTCPSCDANGHQIKKAAYRCLACGTEWRVNEARLCGLKRYTTKTPL